MAEAIKYALIAVACLCTVCKAKHEKCREKETDEFSVHVPYHNCDKKTKIVGEFIKLDETTLKQELEAEKVDIIRLRKIQNTTYFKKKFGAAESLKTYFSEVVKFQGTPVDLFVYLVMPIVLGKIICIFLNYIKPLWTDEKATVTEYPLVPLVYFQQTAKEISVKRSSTRTLEQISKYFIIRANETYIDLQEIRNAAVTRQTLTKSPWALVRFMIRLQMIYAHSTDRGRSRKPKRFDARQQQKNLIRNTHPTKTQDQALYHLAASHKV